jgi:3-hydroxyisobutyrate dehydrogenase-like beta-hydroxyacid dehydrogenase
VMVYLGYQSVLEAVELARAAGVADGLVKQVTSASGSLSPQSEVWLDIYERRRVDPGDAAEQATFATYAALLEKDLRAAAALAEVHGLDLPGTRLMAVRGAATYVVDRSADAVGDDDAS